MTIPESARRVYEFLRACWLQGWRPAWRCASALVGFGLVGAATAAWSLSIAWLAAAALAVLLVGAFYAWAEADGRARADAPKARQAELLQKHADLLAKQLVVSQAQYKVFEGWYREHPPGGQSG